MTSYQFSDDRCKKLFEAAYPVKHFKGFAWRESPQTLDNHWKRATSGKTPAEKDELLKVCLLAGEAQTKYRIEQEKHGEKLHRPKGIAVWFNSGSYYDDIGSHSELAEKQNLQVCCIPDCNLEVMGKRFATCEYHYQHDEKGRLRQKQHNRTKIEMNLVAELKNAFNPKLASAPKHGVAALRWALNKMGDL